MNAIYTLCVYGQNIVVVGPRCSQPSSSWSPPPKSCFGQHPSQYHSYTSQSFFSKPLHFWIPAFLVNLLLEDTPKILDRMKLRDSKRVHLYAGGGSKWAFLHLSFPQSLFCLCSSSRRNSGRLFLVYVLTAASLTILSTKDLSAFIFQPVSLR